MIYDSIDILPIYNYFKCLEGRLEYLNSDGSKEITDEHECRFELIQEQVDEKSGSNAIKDFRMKGVSILRLIEKLNIYKNCAFLLQFERDEDLVEILRGKGLEYRNIEQLKGEIHNLQELIKEKTQPKKEKKQDLFEIVATLKMVLNIQFDVHTTSVSEFLSYIKLANGKK